MSLFKRKEVIVPVPMPRIDIEKDNCAMCLGDGKPSKPVYCNFSIGYHHIHLCKEHFCELMEVLMEFYEKNKKDDEAIEQLMKERDAAVKDLRTVCQHYNIANICETCKGCDMDCSICKWEWRGVQE